MYNFCTLFDSFYLPRGLAMYESLKQQTTHFHLYIFAFDQRAQDILTQLQLDYVTVISLKEFEDEALLKVKSSRSRAEYCWTCTPSTVKYVLKTYHVDACTYIDADLYFYTSPKVLFDEMGDKSVLITEHRYTPAYDRSSIAGKYCVQFITFKNNTDGLAVLDWWQAACLDWCYDRYEDGKFGDQKYLDDWTTRFNGVHNLLHLGGGMAPWNVQQYAIKTVTDEKIHFYNKKDLTTFELVFYHFHYVRFYKNNLVDLGWFKLDKSIIDNIYKPYIKQLDKQKKRVQTLEKTFDIPLKAFTILEEQGLKNKLKCLVKRTIRYNLFKHISI